MKIEIKQLIAVFLLLIGLQQANAQLVVSQYTNESQISAPSSVTLINGFHATGNVRIFTTGISYQNCLPQVSNPSNDQNYILTRTFRERNVNDNNLATVRGICGENQTIQYFDGLGRPLQTVQLNGTLAGHDLVQPFAYDALGREAIKYQPYSVWNNHGAYRADAIVNGGQAGYFANPPSGIKSTGTPFALTVFEPSPLNRIHEQGAAGDAWQPVPNSDAGHTMKIEYGTNIEGEVRLWTINPNGAFTDVKYYNPGKLYKTTTKDENWTSGNAGTTDEFKDFEGRVVLKRVWETDVKSLKTCYLYDDFGNLRYVMPPAVTAGTDRLYGEITSFDESQVEFLDYMYGYHYDSRNRVIEKKIPGKGWEEMIYNPLDQVVLSQDAIQLSNQERSFIKYNAFGQVTMTGVETGHSRTRQSIQDEVNNYQGVYYDSRSTSNANGHGYDYASTPAYWPNMRVDVVNYYDDYENIPDLPNNESANYSKMIKGLLVAQKIRVLGTDVFLWTVNYYDDEGRVVKTYKQHYLSGSYNVANYDDITNSYSFVGELTSTIRIHHANGISTTIADRYEYDHMGRPIASFQKINDQTEVTLAHQVYNELGQLKEKKLNNDLQTTSLAYNERGWMTGSSSNEFSMNLKYNDGTLPQFNGNIANQVYNNGGIGNTFTYNYDKLNRLIKGEVSPTLMSEVITYDVIGNITSLNRDNASPRTYHYKGNKLYFAEYVTNGYVYDVNGNATTDGRNGMVLSYNYLNLPTTANNANMSLSYAYDATGRRLKKIANGVVRNYIDGIEYNSDGTIDFIKTEAGIARKSGNAYVYEYNLTDHLGNVRYSFNQNGTKLQQDDYYAFGMKRNTFASGVKNKYLYNGKEVQEELGEQYDYGARFYDPVIGRFNTIDPLSEVSRRFSPYGYGLNNPIRFIDVDGMYAASPIFDQDGNFLGTDDEGLKGKDIIMKREDFKQGMSHKEAAKKDLGVESLDLEATRNWYSFSKTIESRPDYDGYLTKSEADAWWKGKSGEPLFVDQSKIELPGITTKTFNNKNGTSLYNNFVWDLNNTGEVYGTIKLTLKNASTGNVHLGGEKYLDEYDYKMDGRLLRDIATWVGRPGSANGGKDFFIYGYGHAKVPVKK